MFIADRLTYLKKVRHMTNEEISRQAGVPIGTVNKICAGQTKKPSLHTMDQICRVLQVPLHYLLDDSAPLECSIGAYVTSRGICLLSEAEYANLEKYRQLTQHGRRSIDMLLNSLSDRSQPLADGSPSRKLLCYVPVSQGQVGTLGDAFFLKPLLVTQNALSNEADFAVQVIGNSLEPAYGRGSILLMKAGAARHNQIGMFLLNREVFLRQYHCQRGVHKLVSLNLDVKALPIRNGDDFQPMGVLLGEARGYRWI